MKESSAQLAPIPHNSGCLTDFCYISHFYHNDLQNSSIDVEIQVSSINTQNEKRDNHLRSEEFFNTKKWSDIRFSSSDIHKTGDNQFVASGEITIRDVTENIDLPFTLLGLMDHPRKEGTKVAGFNASTSINRTDFGVGVGYWAATMVVGDDVVIDINL